MPCQGGCGSLHFKPDWIANRFVAVCPNCGTQYSRPACSLADDEVRIDHPPGQEPDGTVEFLKRLPRYQKR